MPDHRNSKCAAKQRVVKSPWSAPADAYPWPMPAAGCATSEECGGKRWEWCQVRWVGAEGQAAILTPGFRVPGAAVRSLLRVVKEDSEVLGHRALALQGLLLSHGGKERKRKGEMSSNDGCDFKFYEYCFIHPCHVLINR